MADSDRAERPNLVVVANDQEWSGRSFETILGPHGFVVLRAYTGRQVLEAARAMHPDLLVLDARMSDMDGIELCRQLRAESIVGANTPIVITGSQPTRAERLSALEAGAWDFCAHPIDADALVLKLENFARAKRVADRMRSDSLVDEDTGLYSIRGLARRAREVAAVALRIQSPLACLAFAPEPLADIGRDEPDTHLSVQLPEHLATLLVRNARAADVLGHLGRSEFAVIAPSTSPRGAERLMDRMQRIMEAAPVVVDGEERRFRIRGGYFAVPNYALSTMDPIEMLERASSALRSEPPPRPTTPDPGPGPSSDQGPERRLNLLQ